MKKHVSHVRIIAGKHKGKKIYYPPIETLRPTPDRVKETIFNWLMNDIQGSHCLDLFAGSGSLGFEAYSRGAASVTLIEQSPEIYQFLKKQIANLGTPTSIQVLHTDAFQFITNNRKIYDIVFLDPPFHLGYINLLLTHAAFLNSLAKEAKVYAEAETIPTLPKWTCLRLNNAGQVHYGLFQRNFLKS